MKNHNLPPDPPSSNDRETDRKAERPAERPDRPSGFYRKYARWILGFLLLLAPGYFWMAGKVLTPGDMSAYLLDVSHWLPNDTLLIQDMEKFSEVAGKERGSVVRISWPGCTESDPRLLQFAGQLRELKWGDTDEAQADENVFDDVVTIDQLVSDMQSTSLNLTDEQVYEQLSNVMIGPEGTTCVIATLSHREPHFRHAAFEKIIQATGRVDGLDAQQLKYFGGPVYTRKVDESGLAIVTNFTPLAVLISAICTWLCIRRLREMLAILLNAIVGSAIALSSLYVLSVPMDPLLMLLPGFWFIMCISAGLHFVNYFFETRDDNDSGNLTDVATQTVRVAFRPSFLATLTTCIGLSSLCTSDIQPLWRFGFHASIGLACSFVSLYMFLPSFMFMFVDQQPRKPELDSSGMRFWNWYGTFSAKFQYKTAILFLLLIGVTLLGFSRLQFSNKLNDQFAESAKINRDTEWFESEIGPVIPFELLVRFPKDNLPEPSECLGYIHEMQDRIQAMALPTKTLSATAMIPYDVGSGARQAIRRTILDRKLNRQRDALEKTGFVIEEETDELWRLSVFAFGSEQFTMSDYFAMIKSGIADHESANVESFPGARVSYAGLGSRMAVITSRLGGGLIRSCFTSIILISIVDVIALRSLTLGLTAMVPNLFPIVFSFGIFGFIRPSLDIGSIMTASIAMGIAVDDTIHFMYWFRKGMANQMTRDDSIRLAINRCGRAIASTSLICGLGFFVFFFCDFMPVARFGQLMFVMLAAALVGDLFFLPALLRSIPEKFLQFHQPSTEPAS